MAMAHWHFALHLQADVIRQCVMMAGASDGNKLSVRSD